MARDEEGFWIPDEEFQSREDVLMDEAREGNLDAFFPKEDREKAKKVECDGSSSCGCYDCMMEAACDGMAEMASGNFDYD